LGVVLLILFKVNSSSLFTLLLYYHYIEKLSYYFGVILLVILTIFRIFKVFGHCTIFKSANKDLEGQYWGFMSMQVANIPNIQLINIRVYRHKNH